VDAGADDGNRQGAFRLVVVIAVWRLPLLVLGFGSLVVGTGAGLARFGWSVPAVAATASSLHGPLMICGFFGVVIALERAVAIGRPWAYAAPLFAGFAGLAAVIGATAVAAWLFVAASLVFLAASADVFRRQTALFTFTMALGALCWAVGNALWAAGAPVHGIVGWWLAFPILTIAGERLELSRFMPPSPLAKRAFAGILVAIGAGLAGLRTSWGPAAFALGLLALSLWLFKQDIARRTVRGKGLTRFIAACLLSGYAWLAIGAATILAAGSLAPGSAAYDAALHALALGFVFSMVFGHAPIILPAVLRVGVPYHPTFYVPLAILHGSLVLRLAGDAAGDFDWTRAGGLGNAVAVASFIVGTASAALRGARAHPVQQP
jgi:hypothetical protein